MEYEPRTPPVSHYNIKQQTCFQEKALKTGLIFYLILYDLEADIEGEASVTAGYLELAVVFCNCPADIV